MPALMAERLDRPPMTLFGEQPEAQPRGRRPAGDASGGPTLDDAIVAAWEGLAARVAVSCPVCDEGMLRPGAHGAGGRCDCCGATLD